MFRILKNKLVYLLQKMMETIFLTHFSFFLLKNYVRFMNLIMNINNMAMTKK